MDIFGLKILTKKGQEKLKQDMKAQATTEMVEFLCNVEGKIILDPKEVFSKKTISEPLTIIGNNQIVANCIFHGIDGFRIR